MKFFIQQVHSEQIEIDIPQDTTLEQLRKLLVSQYSYPDQQMKFINNGIILKDPGALMKVKELGRIIVYIKNKDSKKSHKRSKKDFKEENSESPGKNPNIENTETQENNSNVENSANQENNSNIKNNADQEQESNIENRPEIEPDQQKPNSETRDKEQVKENSNNIEPTVPDTVNINNINEKNEPLELTNWTNISVDAEPIYFPYSKNSFNDSQSITDIPKEQLDSYLADCFKKIHLKQLYDEKCNFYANLNETKRIADMIEHNPGLIFVVSQFTKENFTVAMQRNTIDFEFAMDLAGFFPSSPIKIADDYDAIYSEMPTIYTQIIKKLMKKYNKTQRETVKAFIDSNYDEDAAEKLLQN